MFRKKKSCLGAKIFEIGAILRILENLPRYDLGSSNTLVEVADIVEVVEVVEDNDIGEAEVVEAAN